MAGKQHKNSFAAKVFSAIVQISGEVSTEQIIDHLCLQTKVECKRLSNTLSDLFKAGKVKRVSRGVYQELKPPGQEQRSIHERMWAILRARRAVTVDDLQELAGASENYALEYLQMLCRRKITTKHGNRYRLVIDPGPQPVKNKDNSEKLRLLRSRKKKEALKKIEAARKAVLDIPD